mgnify:CR=1 FL=1
MIGRNRMVGGAAIAWIVVGFMVGGWSGFFFGFLAACIWGGLCGASDGFELRKIHRAGKPDENTEPLIDLKSQESRDARAYTFRINVGWFWALIALGATTVILVAWIAPLSVQDGAKETRSLRTTGDSGPRPSSQKSTFSLVPDNPKKPQQRPKPSRMIAVIQLRLNEFGWNAGQVDGLLGPQTRSAITRFQKFGGLVADGKPSRQVFDILESAVPADRRCYLARDESVTCN